MTIVLGARTFAYAALFSLGNAVGVWLNYDIVSSLICTAIFLVLAIAFDLRDGKTTA